MTAAMTVNVPGRSIERTFSLRGASVGTACGGVVKKNRINPPANPPIGRSVTKSELTF